MATSHKPEQRDNSDNLKYTTHAYNPDDSILSVTDGRGAVTNFEYNSRGLLTEKSWTVPGGSGIPDPADVVVAYDNVGNRTSMTDGLGEVDYEYNSLSQLTAETRDFTDTLTDAPNGVFRLEYSYQIGGQLKSYTDPYGDQISYSHDKRGRLGTVTGTSFGGTTNYAGNPDYRAWGALKHVEYGNGQQATLTFDNRLKPISFLVNDISTPTAELFDRTYEYYADGRLKLVDEHPDGVSEFKNKYDRLFTYDHQGRVQDAKSGVEAHGETETDLFELPYRQSYTHDAFGHVASRTSKLWNYGDWDFAYTYTNNRVTNLTYSYDFDGRTTQADGVTFSYNGAGQMVETKKSAEYETTIDHDGLGKEAKRTSVRARGGCSP
jgi:YD repeat-containing protein